MKRFKKAAAVTLALAISISGIINVNGSTVYADGNTQTESSEQEANSSHYIIYFQNSAQQYGGDTMWSGTGIDATRLFDEDGNITIKFKDGYYYDSSVTNPSSNAGNCIEISSSQDGKTLLGYGDNSTDIKWKYGETITLNKNDFTPTEMSDGEGNPFTDYIYNCVGIYDYAGEYVSGLYYNSDGSQTYQYKSSWSYGDKAWYGDASGYYVSDKWEKIDSLWYYFDSDGYAAKGWINSGGSWYYFPSSGYTYSTNSWVDGCWLGEDGTWSYQATGSWKSDANGWWYEDTNGWYPKSEEVSIDGYYYYFKDNGYMAQDEWVQVYENWWEHFDSNGDQDGYGYYEYTTAYDETGNPTNDSVKTWTENFF